jgi:hypothetical protein
MEPPNLNEWGPALWRILHTFVERIGKRGTVDVAPGDHIRHHQEYEIWMAFLGIMGDVLPCNTCQAHFKEYTAGNPYAVPFTSGSGEGRRLAVRNWLWTFHNSVRTRKGQDCILSLEALPYIYATYSPVAIEADYKMILAHIGRAAFLRIVRQDAMARFSKVVYNLRKFYETG